MSADEFYHKDEPSRLPYLPPELWATIIQHATCVPRGYDPDLTELALGVNANTMNKEGLEALRKALVTRRTLVLVSKAWYTLASPFLYEYILLRKGDVVPHLLRGMHRTEQSVQSEDTTRPIGWWTKRLDVNFRDSTSNPRADVDVLADLMTRLPNLRVLTFSITGHHYKEKLPPNVLASVSCRESLKFVHFYTYCFPSMESWHIFLAQHPYVESANLYNHIFVDSFHTRLEYLRTIHIEFDTLDAYALETSSWSTHLSAIRAATYDLGSTYNKIHAEIFFTNFGPTLTTIQLSQLEMYRVGDIDHAVRLKDILQQTFELFLSKCPALEQINLLFFSWSTLTLFVPHLPSKVSTLVIRVIKAQISKKMIIRLFHETFVAMKGQNPNLKTIQFSSGMNVQKLRSHSTAFACGLRLMSEIGVIIKDDEGRVMV